MKKKIARVAESQNSMAEAMARGNLNQIGRTAWYNMVDLCQEMVVDEINDALEECSDAVAANLDKQWEEIQTKLDKLRAEHKNVSDAELRKSHAGFNQLKVEEQDVMKKLCFTVNNITYPQLCNKAVPKYLYTETYNNRWDLCHGYMTTDLTDDKMEAFYEAAVEDPNTQVDVDHKQRMQDKEAMRTIAEAMEYPCYYTCSGRSGHTCPMPNLKKTPDISVTIIPEDPKKYLKIPIFTWEVIGKKKIRERGKRQFPGFVAALQCLATGPYTYYAEVDGDSVTIYKLERVPDEGRIQISVEKITYASTVDGAMAFSFATIFERLTEIFVDIFINLTWVKYECSRLMKCADYRNFIAEQDGRHERGVEMHCWHMFEAKYFTDNKVQVPVECHPEVDKCDEATPRKDRGTEVEFEDIDYTIPADELVPPISSNTEVADIPQILRDILTSTDVQNVWCPRVSRAVRNPASGVRCNPYNDNSWERAFNQFLANLSYYIRLKIPEFAGVLKYEQFDTVFNPKMKQLAPSERKQIAYMAPDPDVAAQHLDDDSSDDDEMINVEDFADLFQIQQFPTPQQTPALGNQAVVPPLPPKRVEELQREMSKYQRPPSTPLAGNYITNLSKMLYV